MGAPKAYNNTSGSNRRKLLLSVVLVASVAPMLAACGGTGFRPLHATGGFGANASASFAKVQFAPIPGRVGQRIRNELIFQATGGGQQTLDPKYRLEVAIRESVAQTLVQRDGESTGQIYNLDVSFQLVNLETKAVVMQGQSFGRAGFERFESIYANVRARRNAENRAAKTVGNDLKTRLESYLATTT